MSYWLTELQQLESILAGVEADPRAMANLDQVARTLEPDESPAWAINEAVTTGLHRVFLFASREDYAQNYRPHIARRTGDALEALAQMTGYAPGMFAAIIRTLDGGENPISTPAFWETYFDLLDAPSEFRVLPRTYDPAQLPDTWETVHQLQQAGQIHAAVELGRQLIDDDNSKYKRARTPLQKAARDLYLADRKRLEPLNERVEKNMRLVDAHAIERDLREMDTFVIDSPIANEAKGRLPELRRQQHLMSDSVHRELYVDVHRIERVKNAIHGWLTACSVLYMFGLIVVWLFRWEEPFTPRLLFVLVSVVGFVVVFAAAIAAEEARPRVWAWLPPACVAAAVAAVYTFESLWGAVLAVAAFAPMPLLYRRAVRRKAWLEWNDFVHAAGRLTQEANGGGIHTVRAIESSSPWVVELEPMPGTPESFQRIRTAEDPGCVPGDVVALTRAGEIAARITADKAQLGMEAAGGRELGTTGRR